MCARSCAFIVSDGADEVHVRALYLGAAISSHLSGDGGLSGPMLDRSHWSGRCDSRCSVSLTPATPYIRRGSAAILAAVYPPSQRRDVRTAEDDRDEITERDSVVSRFDADLHAGIVPRTRTRTVIYR